MVYINDSHFVNNKVEIKTFLGGSAILIYGVVLKTILFIKNCSFVNNYSLKYGGAIMVGSGMLYDYGSIYVNNTSLQSGAAVAVATFCSYQITNGIFLNNKGKYNGIIRIQSGAYAFFDNCRISENSMEIGSIVSIERFFIDLLVFS